MKSISIGLRGYLRVRSSLMIWLGMERRRRGEWEGGWVNVLVSAILYRSETDVSSSFPWHVYALLQ